MKTRRGVGMFLMGMTLAMGGCGFLTDLLRGTLVTVNLVNETESDVEVTLFFDDEQDIPEFLLIQSDVGTQRTFTIPPGQTISFAEACDDLQALIVENASLRILGGLGPEASTDVLRDGDDFGCGETITLRFDDSGGILNFDVAFERG